MKSEKLSRYKKWKGYGYLWLEIMSLPIQHICE